MKNDFLIYGACGYTAKLTIQLAVNQGLAPILAGRSAEKLEPLARQFGLEYRAFDLDDSAAVDAGLAGVKVVLHCAGPFIFTGRQMMEGCLRNGCHYLDITGEFPVFEFAASLDLAAKKAGLMVMPGVGFDVVPTDCLALFLKKRLPDATHLKLAFATTHGQVSRGTRKSMINKLGDGGMIRRDGKLTRVPLGHQTMDINFDGKNLLCMAIPWGDVATAFYTTSIPNIEVYIPTSKKTVRKLNYQFLFNWLLRIDFIKKMALKKIKKMPEGPTEERREKSVMQLWGEVSNARGEQKTARFSTPNGYTLTAISSLHIAQKVLAGHFKTGFQTPAGCFGEGLIQEMEGVSEFVSGEK